MTFGYRYEGEIPFSHQPKMIYSPSYYEDMTLLGWNTNGQMTSMVQPNQDRFRKHLWDEAGQLAVAIGNEYCGYYGYNANGERVYKLTGTVLADQYDAGDVNIETYFDDIVLYVNPYMVVTPKGYTKHYYNGSERIAARLGDYWYDAGAMGGGYEKADLAREVLEDRLNSGNTDEEYFEEEYYYSEEIGDIWCEPYTLRTTYSSCTYVEDMLYSVFDGGTRMADEMYGIDKGIFYYHSDHLGSASWITDDQGNAVQYIHYMPYGELWLNQQANSYDERFKFTSKERDTETGYDYYGARYYSSMLGHWLSPDPLSNKYPNISPYAYCHWNPITRIDPDGNADYYDVDGNHIGNDNVDDNRVYQQDANGEHQFMLGVLDNPNFTYKGDVKSVRLEFNGEMASGNRKAIGKLSLIQEGDNFEFERANFTAVSGSSTKDCLPNGEYTTNNFRYRNDQAGFIKDGIGFSVDLLPQFDTNRTLLRIHPDGNLPGTEGCIGLNGNRDALSSFVNLLSPQYRTIGNIPLNVNIKNNPNYHH